jgi:hypothetical protein
MDQFRKKTINQEGKKKEAEEDLVRTSWEENTGDGAAKSHRPLHYIFRSSVTRSLSFGRCWEVWNPTSTG